MLKQNLILTEIGLFALYMYVLNLVLASFAHSKNTLFITDIHGFEEEHASSNNRNCFGCSTLKSIDLIWRNRA